MNIGNINSVRGPEEVSSVRSTPVLRPAPLGSAPLPNDSVRVDGAAPRQEVSGKPLAQARDEFKVGLANLKNQSDDDKNAIRDIARMVDERTDLNSKEKEWLFASEMGAYTADAAMSMTSLEKKGQPWTAKQQSRFEALTKTYLGAKGVADAVTPMVARPESAPTFEAAAPGAQVKAAAPLSPAPLQPAPPVGVLTTPSASAPAAADGSAPPATPPAPPKDPLVAIWESRRQEAQDIFNDYKALMQKMTEWKQRIIASRIAFFWKVYGAHTTFLSDGWKR